MVGFKYVTAQSETGVCLMEVLFQSFDLCGSFGNLHACKRSLIHVRVFLELRKNYGSEERKAHLLFNALWIPDIFRFIWLHPSPLAPHSLLQVQSH